MERVPSFLPPEIRNKFCNPARPSRLGTPPFFERKKNGRALRRRRVLLWRVLGDVLEETRITRRRLLGEAVVGLAGLAA